MEITNKDYIKHESKEIKSSIYGDYTYYNVDVTFNIVIDEKELLCVFQTGLTTKGNDFGCPSNNFELSEGGGCDPVLIAIWSLFEGSGFYSDDDLLDQINGQIKKEFYISDMKKVYDLIKENTPKIENYI